MTGPSADTLDGEADVPVAAARPAWTRAAGCACCNYRNTVEYNDSPEHHMSVKELHTVALAVQDNQKPVSCCNFSGVRTGKKAAYLSSRNRDLPCSTHAIACMQQQTYHTSCQLSLHSNLSLTFPEPGASVQLRCTVHTT